MKYLFIENKLVLKKILYLQKKSKLKILNKNKLKYIYISLSKHIIEKNQQKQ